MQEQDQKYAIKRTNRINCFGPPWTISPEGWWSFCATPVLPPPRSGIGAGIFGRLLMREALMVFVTEEAQVARKTSFPLLASPEDRGERVMVLVEYIRGVVFCSLRL